MSEGTASVAERVKFLKSRFDMSHLFEKTCLGSDCTEEHMVVSRGRQCGERGKVGEAGTCLNGYTKQTRHV